MGKQANFTRMQDGTKADWEIIADAHKENFAGTADRFLGLLRQLEDITVGFKVNQLHHCLMTATLARRSGNR